MNKNGKFLPVSLATMVILGAISLAAAASDSTASTENDTPRPATEMRVGPRADVKAAIEAGDYDAWVKAVSINGQVPEFLKVITNDNFAQFVSMHQLIRDGKKDEAKVIADELGLKMGMGLGMGKGEFQGPPKVNQAAEAAIASGDYDAWVKAISVNGKVPTFLQVITKDNFAKFVEASNYRKQAGELMKKSETIMDELGIKRPGPEGERGHRGGKGRFGGESENNQNETEVK